MSPVLAPATVAAASLLPPVKAAAIELGPFGIRVNSVHPWGINTRLADEGEDVWRLLKENPTFATYCAPDFTRMLPVAGTVVPSPLAIQSWKRSSDGADVCAAGAGGVDACAATSGSGGGGISELRRAAEGFGRSLPVRRRVSTAPNAFA